MCLILQMKRSGLKEVTWLSQDPLWCRSHGRDRLDWGPWGEVFWPPLRFLFCDVQSLLVSGEEPKWYLRGSDSSLNCAGQGSWSVVLQFCWEISLRELGPNNLRGGAYLLGVNAGGVSLKVCDSSLGLHSVEGEGTKQCCSGPSVLQSLVISSLNFFFFFLSKTNLLLCP